MGNLSEKCEDFSIERSCYEQQVKFLKEMIQKKDDDLERIKLEYTKILTENQDIKRALKNIVG